MRALVFERYADPMSVQEVAEPDLPDNGVILSVKASGICRSDYHAWQGHDPIDSLPHVPGHEFAGEVLAVGSNVQKFQVGQRVTAPFSIGCGQCHQCRQGRLNICDDGITPGFSTWGSAAEQVAVHHADVNLAHLPEEIDYVTAASLGCRYITAFRAVVDQGRLRGSDRVVVHGCGGLGLACVQIAASLGAEVIAVDISPAALELASKLGASHLFNARDYDSTGEELGAAIRAMTQGGAELSLDALGSGITCRNSLLSLGKRGRHVQIGLLAGEGGTAELPVEWMIGRELEFLGSRGMPAWRYERLFDLIGRGILNPAALIEREVSLEEAAGEYEAMGQFSKAGIAVISRF
ncbi:zinc-dependent alcohol dehydrogenase family protein [Rhodovibrionaceae bacterium A322]